MILPSNINLSGLNIVKNQIATNQSTGFDNVFDELLKLFFENKDTSTDGVLTDNNFFVYPFISLQNILMQDINFQELSQSAEFSAALKTTLFKLFQSGQMDIKELTNLLQNLKSQNKYEIQSFLENFNQKSFLNTENSQIKELTNLLNSQKIQNNQVSEQFKLNIQPENSNQNRSLLFNIVDENYSENRNIKPKFMNTDTIQKSVVDEKLSSQLNIFNNTQSKSNETNNIQQKIELPFTQLKEVSDIVFKALSGSQKTIIVQLEPPELGKILIKLSMDNAGVRADMKVDYPHVKEALTGLIPEIKSNLQSSGVKVSDFLLDLMKDNHGYSDSYNGQGQRKYRGNQKFFEYFA